MSRRPPPMPKEEPAIPIEPAVAKARANYVKDMIVKINGLRAEGKNEEEIRQAVGKFAEDYSALFKKVMAGETDQDGTLRTMIAMLERMGNGQLTQDQASVIIGQRLYDRHVKPKLNENGSS
jgi:hypothetical protein